MQKFPFVKQHDLKDCGVSCLLMIIMYYEGYINLEKLRDMTHTTKNGVSAYHLVETAKKIGFNSYGIKVDNLENLKLPCIAFVTLNKSFNHYVVIYEINYKKRYLIIADPASRIKKVSFHDFDKIFNNIVLVFDKTKNLPLYTKNIKFSKFFTKILLKYKAYFIKIILLSFLITLLSIIASFYIELITSNYSLLFKIFYLFISVYLFKNLSEYIRNKILFKVHKKINEDLTNETFNKIISLPYRYFKNRTTGEVLTRINDIDIINQTIIKIIVTFLLDLVLSVLSGIVLFIISIKLFIISLIVLVFYILIILLFSNKVKTKLEKIKEEKAFINSYIVENISGFETIKGLGIEKSIIDKYIKLNNKMILNNYKYEKLYNFEEVFKNIISDLGYAIVILIGLLIIKNNQNIGSLITCSSLFVYFMSPIKNIIELNKDIKDAKISYSRINELFINDKINTKFYNLPFKNIKFNNLNYSYDQIKNTLSNININIKGNEKIMIVGTSGSGKSTLLKLLKKYYLVENNQLYIDDIDINNISEYEINKNITYISQNELLFTDTLYNNLVLNRNINDKKVYKVIKDTYIDFMNELRLNMPIEENGFNLSGGQKSRIILARGILNNFKILILDEIFSQMDIDLERKILKNIFKRYKDKLIIVVSHRNNNLDLFDRVIEMSDGKINKDIKKTSQ